MPARYAHGCGRTRSNAIDIEKAISIAWLLATLGALAAAGWLAAHTPTTPVRRGLLVAALVATWLVLQGGAFVLVLGLFYCENCAGRPFSARDAAAYAILWTPTLLAWCAVLAWGAWLRRHERRTGRHA